MTEIDNTRYTSHHEVSKLLPWYVNGCLGREEACLIERHLEICLHCRTEMTQQRQLSECIKRSEVGKLASQASFRRLKKRIQHVDHLQTPTTQVDPRPARAVATVRAWYNGFEPKYRMAWVVCILIILPALLVTTVFIDKLRSTEYRTLANPDRRESTPSDIAIVFADGVDPLQRNKILSGIGAQIIEGPSSRGIIRVRVANRESDQPAMITALSSLRQRPEVVYAQPALSKPTRSSSGDMRN